MEIEERIEKLLKDESTRHEWGNRFTSEEWKNATAVNKHIFGLHLNQSPGCECLDDLFKYVRHANNKHAIIMDKERNFRIKKGLVIKVHGCTPVGYESTEEQCIELLRSHPGHIVSFERYPSNWQEIVSGETPKAAKAAKKVEKVEEVAEEVKEVAEQVAPNGAEGMKVITPEEIGERFTSNELKDLITGAGIELPKNRKKDALIQFCIEHKLV